VLRATGGGILQFTGNGKRRLRQHRYHQAQTGSEVQLVTNVSITAELSTPPAPGSIDVYASNTANLASVTLAGNVIIVNNARLA